MQHLTLPRDAKILSVHMVDGTPCLYAMVDTIGSTSDVRQIDCYGTRHDIPRSDDIVYIGTVVAAAGDVMVWHYFERLC